MMSLTTFALVVFAVCGLSSAVLPHHSCYSNFDYGCYVLRKLEEHIDAISSIKQDVEDIVSKCPDSWMAYEGSCYLFSNQKMNFHDAQSYCEQSGAHLIHVNDLRENNFIRGMLSRFKDQSWWLGLTDGETEGNWKLVGKDDFPDFTDWSPGEPESAGGTANEDCAAYYHPLSYRWVDANCNTNWSPICEKWYIPFTLYFRYKCYSIIILEQN